MDVAEAESTVAAEEHQSDSGDAFLGFVDYARSILLPGEANEEEEDAGEAPSWSRMVSRILKTCIAYPSGVTSGILLSDLHQCWNEQRRAGTFNRKSDFPSRLRKKHKRKKLSNTVTIDTIYEKNFLSTKSVLETIVLDTFVLPGTQIYMLKLGDDWSSGTIDLFLHRRFYDLVQCEHGILKKGREIFLTGCCLRTTAEGSGHLRLLPTEYLVIILDEVEDEDAMLLGAQFCSDTFSSISLDAVKSGASYSLYARIDSIGSVELHGKFASLQQKEIILVDNDNSKIKFLLWGEQVALANLFSVGSMLGLDKPFVANDYTSCMQTGSEVCLEYGSATQLYMVPLVQHEEQVLVASTQNRFEGSRLLSAQDQTQGFKVSQVALPCNSQGSIDFSNYPFRAFVSDLRDKMTGISLYGTVANIFRLTNMTEPVFSLRIEDTTGAVTVKLHFAHSWSLGRLGVGHTIFLAGLACSKTRENLLEVTWFEKDAGASFVNLSCLPALLNSSCLHKLSHLSDLSIQADRTFICCVHVDQIEYHRLNSRFCHALCGQLVDEGSVGLVVCNFCRCACEGEIIRAFYFEVTVADESTNVSAWCTGQTAAELLQISTDEFYELPEDEQAMYLYTLENERFMVAIVNSKGRDSGQEREKGSIRWEIARALKCE